MLAWRPCRCIGVALSIADAKACAAPPDRIRIMYRLRYRRAKALHPEITSGISELEVF